jgi:hypothetical protein
MAFDKGSLDGYVDVATRIAEFRAAFPDGRLRPVNPDQPYRIETVGNDTFITYTAACYRSPDDPLPGIGTAQEAYPGKTPYTRGSEIQNAETSAWGRAIVAALQADTRKGIASHEEVRNRQAERDEEWETAKPPDEKQAALYVDYEKRINSAKKSEQIDAIGVLVKDARGAEKLTHGQYRALGMAAQKRRAQLPAEVAS